MPVVHIHGFAISGEYLMPTRTDWPDAGSTWSRTCPGTGGASVARRSSTSPRWPARWWRFSTPCDIDTAVLVGNSMGCPIGLEVAHRAPERVHRLVLVSPAGGEHNQPLSRALGQLATDALRESPRMLPVALPDYVRFGPLNGLRLFHELTRFPSLERLVHTPVPTLAVLGGRDPLMPSPGPRPRGRPTGPAHLSVALIERAAHAVNFSHPDELAGVSSAWLDGALADGARLPSGVRLVHDENP